MAKAAVARAAALAGGAADRYPCGKLKPTHPPTTIKRIVESAIKRGENPLLGTPIGWLLLHNEITSKQTSAAGEYARMRTAYDLLFGLPRRSARTLGETILHSHWTDQDAAAVRRTFDLLQDKIEFATPRGATCAKIISILDDTCIDLQMPSWADQILLRIGLDVVADYFRIDTGAKKAA